MLMLCVKYRLTGFFCISHFVGQLSEQCPLNSEIPRYIPMNITIRGLIGFCSDRKQACYVNSLTGCVRLYRPTLLYLSLFAQVQKNKKNTADRQTNGQTQRQTRSIQLQKTVKTVTEHTDDLLFPFPLALFPFPS